MACRVVPVYLARQAVLQRSGYVVSGSDPVASVPVPAPVSVPCPFHSDYDATVFHFRSDLFTYDASRLIACHMAYDVVSCHVCQAVREYYLASAFEKVLLQRSGYVGLTGGGAQTLFMRGFFDKYGIKPEVFAREVSSVSTPPCACMHPQELYGGGGGCCAGPV